MQAPLRAHLRAHVSAAPLKLGNKELSEEEQAAHLRAHVSAAPLKQRQPGRRQRRRDHLRAHVSAAPLKLERVEQAHGRGRESPRSRERGPVEALEAEDAVDGLNEISALT